MAPNYAAKEKYCPLRGDALVKLLVITFAAVFSFFPLKRVTLMLAGGKGKNVA